MNKKGTTSNSKGNTSKEGLVEVFTPYITVKGKRIYHPTGGVFHFFAKPRSK